MLAHILDNPAIKAKVEAEAREGPFKDMPAADGTYDAEDETLPYIRACMKEVLRMYISILTHRRVTRDVPITTSAGATYRLQGGDMLSVASYVRHYDERIYADPHVFRPERWLDGTTYPEDHWFPFSKGRYSCSGQHLAKLEMPLLTALLFRRFDMELLGPLPAADWSEVVASVRPVGWPEEDILRMRYTARAGHSGVGGFAGGGSEI